MNNDIEKSIVFEYSVEKGELAIKNRSSGEALWSGKPLNHTIGKLLTHPEGNQCFALFPNKEAPRLYPEGPRKAFNNLVCINSKGEVAWVADLPGSGVDYYSNILWSNDLNTEIFTLDFQFNDLTLIAFSYSGFLVSINLANGKIDYKLLIK